ncbi:MAG: hypothetical protein EPO02_13830 [Nitrospirae bacterium]|nr:MAG: hypothetical protein EPO02_13830 [Nitrospirota bacterium]
MTTVKASYSGPTSVSFGTGATALASGSAVISDAFDNSTNLFLDASFYAAITLASGTMGSDKLINVWGAASEDGTHYTGSGTNNIDSIAAAPYAGTAAVFTLTSPTSLFGPFVINTPTNTTTGPYYIVIPSVRDFFGGVIIPKKFALVVENRTGQAFTSFVDSAGAAHKGEWTGFYLTNQ